MSDDPWPESGPGVTEWLDGKPSKREPGRRVRPGSRRSKPTMYDQWRDILEPVVFGRSIRVTINPARFNADIKRLRVQLGEGADERLVAGFKRFAAAIEARHLNIDGKPAWPVFVGRWAKYVPGTAARPQTASDEVSDFWS